MGLCVGLCGSVSMCVCAFPSPGDLPDPGIEPEYPVSLALQADSLPAEPTICFPHLFPKESF